MKHAAPSWRRCAMLAAALVAIPVSSAPAQEAESFSGRWVASGSRTLFDFVPGREVASFAIAGHVNLENGVGDAIDFWSECIGLSDSAGGSTGRCVWRDFRGRRVFSVLSGRPLDSGVAVTGEIVGGTGNLEGITGAYAFTWHVVDVSPEDGVVTGQSRDLAGTYRIPQRSE
ncbi:MAG: hypothetical protein ACQGVC_08750 [Myxococcota bacterium]